MMFSAGMGIGLMFYGVAEPLTHFVTPPPGTGEAGPEASGTAMATTLFHWGLHPWAIYAVVGLAIAYGTYRKGRRQLISSAFVPLLGRRAPRARSARSSTSSRSSRRCSARPPRWAWAPCRSAAASRSSAGIGDGRHAAARRHHRGADRSRFVAVRGVGRRQGHPVAVEHQHGAGARARAVRVRRRPDGVHPQPDADRARRLRPPICRRCRPAPAPTAATTPRLAVRLDDLLLGLVDLLDARSSACSSPASAGAARSASSSPA